MQIDMAALGSRYFTQVTLSIILPAGWTQLLPADPMRYFVRFDNYTNPGGAIFVTSPGPNLQAANPSFTNIPFESKWSENVSRTTGEWYVFCPIGARVLTTVVNQLP